jgi:glyoxylase-like metal-dependent hydrolase (beta-lactamase superfamily II)
MKACAITSNIIRLDGGSMYGHVPKGLWEKWTPSDERNRIRLACRTLFLQTEDGRNLLFDVGIGNFFEPHLIDRYGVEGEFELLKSLEREGVREHEIDAVILSHLHFDHVGGLLSPYNQNPPRLLFPRAKYYVSKAHWTRVSHLHCRERASFIPSLISLLRDSERLALIEDATHPDLLGCGLTFGFSDGHTIGLLLSQLELPTGPLVYASDLIPALPWVHLPITMGCDRFSELVVDEKERFLKRLIEQKGRIFFTHDLNTACAQVTQNKEGKYVGTPLDLRVS